MRAARREPFLALEIVAAHVETVGAPGFGLGRWVVQRRLCAYCLALKVRREGAFG